MADFIIKGKTPIPEGTMEDFKRPVHPDFATSSELKKMEFTGIRENSITQEIEIWTVGDLRFHMSLERYRLFPEEFNSAYANVFKLHDVKGG